MFIQHNSSMSEVDDFLINVKPLIKESEEAIPICLDESSILIGWRIQMKY